MQLPDIPRLESLSSKIISKELLPNLTYIYKRINISTADLINKLVKNKNKISYLMFAIKKAK